MPDGDLEALNLSILLQPQYIAEPYPFYHQLRAQDPVHWDEGMQSWFLTCYSDVISVLRDPQFSTEGLVIDTSRFPQAVREAVRPAVQILTRQILVLEAPDHTYLRRLIARALAPQMVDRLYVHMQRCIDRLLDAVRENGEAELIHELAYPFTTFCMADMFGIPAHERRQFIQWANDYKVLLEGHAESSKEIIKSLLSVNKLVAYMKVSVARRREHPQDDLLQILINAEEHEGILQNSWLSEDDLLSNYALLFIVGQKTLVHTIGNGLLALMRHPDQLEQLRRDPSLLSTTITEILRYDGPIKLLARFAGADCEIGGKHILAGQKVLLGLSAANRDPAHFPEPDRFDIQRPNKRYLSFGHGMHNCLGAYLARMQAEVVLGTLCRRFDELHLRSQAQEWLQSPFIRGLRRLPITFSVKNTAGNTSLEY
jgi:cytochrome P450